MRSCVDNVAFLERGIPKLVKYVTNEQFQEHLLEGNHLSSALPQLHAHGMQAVHLKGWSIIC